MFRPLPPGSVSSPGQGREQQWKGAWLGTTWSLWQGTEQRWVTSYCPHYHHLIPSLFSVTWVLLVICLVFWLLLTVLYPAAAEDCSFTCRSQNRSLVSCFRSSLECARLSVVPLCGHGYSSVVLLSWPGPSWDSGSDSAGVSLSQPWCFLHGLEFCLSALAARLLPTHAAHFLPLSLFSLPHRHLTFCNLLCLVISPD